MYSTLATALVMVFLCAPVYAAAGDPCGIHDFVPTTGAKASKPWAPIKTLSTWCVYLAENVTENIETPARIDIRNYGIPHLLSVELSSNNGCSAGQVSVRSSKVEGGLEIDTSDPPEVLDVSGVGTVAYPIPTLAVPVGLFWSTTATAVDCPAGQSFDVMLIGYNP